MKKNDQLPPGWYSEEPVDFEYNQYRLLAYIQHVNRAFRKSELYPAVTDLKRKLNEVHDILMETENLDMKFKQKVKGIDFENLKLIYQKEYLHGKEWEEIKKTLDFSVNKLGLKVSEGKEIVEFIKTNCEIEPVGLMPLYMKEGYLLVQNNNLREVLVYRYSGKVLANDPFGEVSVSFSFFDRISKVLGESLTSVKQKLIARFQDMPNPATFSLFSKHTFPVEPALLPIAGRVLPQYI